MIDAATAQTIVAFGTFILVLMALVGTWIRWEVNKVRADFDQLRNDFEGLGAQMNQNHQEMRQEFREFRREMRQDMQAFRQDVLTVLQHHTHDDEGQAVFPQLTTPADD